MKFVYGIKLGRFWTLTFGENGVEYIYMCELISL